MALPGFQLLPPVKPQRAQASHRGQKSPLDKIPIGLYTLIVSLARGAVRRRSCGGAGCGACCSPRKRTPGRFGSADRSYYEGPQVDLLDADWMKAGQSLPDRGVRGASCPGPEERLRSAKSPPMVRREAAVRCKPRSITRTDLRLSAHRRPSLHRPGAVASRKRSRMAV